jgi:secondary thiamine-phosphate synthase enzyme
LVESREIRIKTNGNCEIVDITGRVAREIDESRIESGIATVFAVGSTAGIGTIEYEPGLVADFKACWERLIPSGVDYQHNRAWGDGNGHSHMRASILGPSVTVPFTRKKMMLGTWQQIVYADFDNRPRSREIVVQILGE